MLKNILNLHGVQKLSKSEQTSIMGGTCFGTNPPGACVCNYGSYCVYVEPNQTCAGGGQPIC